MLADEWMKPDKAISWADRPNIIDVAPGGGGLRQEEIAIRKQTKVGGSSKTLFACFMTTDIVYSILLVNLQHVMF